MPNLISWVYALSRSLHQLPDVLAALCPHAEDFEETGYLVIKFIECTGYIDATISNCISYYNKDMRCPQCQNDEDKVLETRVLANGAMIRRRRMCIHCDFRFTSYERIENQKLTVIKRNNEREEFDREKLERGITNAVRKRPVSLEQIQNILDNIEEALIQKAGASKEILSSELGELVIENLENIDEVAYLRFASVYRNFETVDEFMHEIKILSKHKKKKRK